MDIQLNEEEIYTILGWFSVYRNEVDISERSMELFKRIEPMLPSDYLGVIQSVKNQFKNQ